MNGATALVTGGTRFIGSPIVARLLDAGNKVTALGDLSPGVLSNLPDPLAQRLAAGEVRHETAAPAALASTEAA